MNKIIQSKLEIIRDYRGDSFASVFDTAVSIYPSFVSRFLGLAISFNNRPGFTYQGSHKLEESLISIGQPVVGDGVSPYIYERMALRFGVDEAITRHEKVGGYALSIISFSHEIGHSLQDEPKEFKRFFNTEPYSDTEIAVDVTTLADRDNYAAYVNKSDEVNADYIARTILANTAFGSELLGIELPEQDPLDWQTWADNHRFIP